MSKSKIVQSFFLASPLVCNISPSVVPIYIPFNIKYASYVYTSYFTIIVIVIIILKLKGHSQCHKYYEALVKENE